MHFTRFIFQTFFLIYFSNSLNAQFFKNITQNSEQKNEQNNPKKINTTPSKIEFSTSIDVQITSGNDSQQLHFHFGENLVLYGMTTPAESLEESLQSITIFEDNAITLFLNSPGFKIKKSIPQEQFSMNNYASIVPDGGEIKKTGLTKNILGFHCHQYYYANKKGSISAWASNDFPVKNVPVSMLGMKNGSPIQGFILELEVRSGNEKAIVKVTKLNSNNQLIINTIEYKNF